jgi:hypothetical protein
MKIEGKPRRSILFPLFVGVLAGSVFSGSAALANIPISTVEQLEAINSSANENYVLLNNIEITSGPSNGNSYVSGEFWGTFDGNNKTISGLTAPLFNIIGGDGSASVRNLNLETSDAGVTGNGVLANSTYLGAAIENVQVSGDVTGTTDNVGGLVGSFSGDITNSSVTGTVIGTNTAGGLVGLAFGNILDSTFTGTVQGQRYIGGLVGSTGSSTISNSSASGIVTGLNGGEGNIGGLVGGGSGAIINSTSSVAVTGYEGTSNIGGLIGYADVSVQITDSSSSGTVTGTSNVGGVAGQIAGSFISNSSSSAAVSGVNNVGGLVGNAIGGSYFGTARGIPSPENGDPGFLPAEIEDSHSTGAVNGGTHAGGLVGRLEGDVTSSYSIGTVNQLLTGHNVGNRLGGLVGVMASGSVSDSYATGGGYSLEGFDYVGGLIGQSEGNINNSYASFSGNVSGYGYVGGLIGSTNGNVTNSYSSVTGDVSSTTGYVGGLAGYAGGAISNSYSYVSGAVSGQDNVGGLVGYTSGSDISNSYAEGNAAGYRYVGGLVGTNYDGSYGVRTITNSYAAGDVTGYEVVGGLVGDNFATITNSYSAGVVTGTGGGYIGDFLGGANTEITDSSGKISNPLTISEVVDVLNTGFEGNPIFAQNETINDGRPYLISLFCTYENTCEDDDSLPLPRLDRFEREFREVIETRSPEKIEKTLGFKNETALPKDAVIAFLQSTDKIDIAKVKSFEITPNSVVRVSTKTEEALQISLKSESKAPVELWVLSTDGKWLLAGVITFDKDGKAILPPLQFKNAGDYSLVFSTPSADSAKASAPFNIGGQVIVSVI